MKAFLMLVGAVLLLGVVPRSAVGAEEFPTEAYYIYSGDDECVTVWCDLTPCLNAKTVKQLKDGIDIAIECRLSLAVPRRLIGAREVALHVYVPRLAYRTVTGEYLLSDLRDTSVAERAFVSLAGLYSFLRDSVEVCMIPQDSLDEEDRFELRIKVTSVSLTDFNSLSTRGGEGDSPIEFLFKQFLDFTSYGRNEFETSSRPFRLDELEPLPE